MFMDGSLLLNAFRVWGKVGGSVGVSIVPGLMESSVWQFLSDIQWPSKMV